MITTLAEVTSVQCRPLGGYAYPSRHDENMNSLSTDFDDNSEADDESLHRSRDPAGDT